MPGGQRLLEVGAARRAPPWRRATAFEPGCFRMPIAWTGTPFERAMRRDVLEAVLDERDVAERGPVDCPTAATTMLRSVSRSAASPRTRTSSARPPFVDLAARRRHVLLLERAS